ncbi:unnamed protein product [Protopolystoma xenopodis]|uniref:Uncharacterized protein n=1 Tax=Protopolystoma xenopodis TaxID=117903 RepID=A0A448XRA5_9PLAT|nr:unnamed protein product [Protopolystoma xenopodis]
MTQSAGSSSVIASQPEAPNCVVISMADEALSSTCHRRDSQSETLDSEKQALAPELVTAREYGASCATQKAF